MPSRLVQPRRSPGRARRERRQVRERRRYEFQAAKRVAIHKGRQLQAIERGRPRVARRHGRAAQEIVSQLSIPSARRVTRIVYGRRRAQGPRLRPKRRTTGPTYTPADPLVAEIEREIIQPAQRRGLLPKQKPLGHKIARTVADVGLIAIPEAAPSRVLTAVRAVRSLPRGAKAVRSVVAREAGRTTVGEAKQARAIERAVRSTQVPRAARRSQRALATTRKARGARTVGMGPKPSARVRAGIRTSRAVSKAPRPVRRASIKTGRKAAAGARRAREIRAASRALKAERGRALNALPNVIAAGPHPVAIAEGHVRAVRRRPGKVAKTTGRAIPALVTAPVGIAANVGLSGKRAAVNAAALAQGKRPPYSAEEVASPTVATARDVAHFTTDFARTMASGDPERIAKAVEEEYGLTAPLIAGIPGARLARGPYRLARTKARRGAERRRAAKGKRRRPETRTPQPISRRAERHQIRRDESIEAAQMRARGQLAAQRAAAPVIREARKAAGARKTIRGRGKLVDPGDTINFLARESINLDDPVVARQQVEDAAAKYGPRPADLQARRDVPNTFDVIDYLRAHPLVLSDPHVRRAVEIYRKQAKPLETSVAAKYGPLARTHGRLLPEERVPVEIRGKTRAKSRAEVQHEIGPKGAEGRRLRALRRRVRTQQGRARALRAELRQRERTEPNRAVTKRRQQELANVEADVRGLAAERRALEQRVREKGRALRRPDERALRAEFEAEMQQLVREKGYAEPAYTHHAGAEPTMAGSGRTYPRAGKKQHRRTGAREEKGLIDESLQALVSGSIAAPRLRRTMHEHTQRFAAERSIAITDQAGKSKRLVTRSEAARAKEAGQFSERDVAFMPLQQIKQAVTDPTVDFDRVRAGAAESLKGEILDRAKHPGEKGILVDREAAKEFFGQMEAVNGLSRAIAQSGRVTSRLILGTSPAWAAAQVLAEGAQAFAAVPRPVLLARALQAAHRMPEKERIAWSSLAGETPGVAVTARDLQLTLRPETNTMMRQALSAMDRTWLGRQVRRTGTAEWLGIFDRWKGGAFRRAVLGAHLQREYGTFMRGIRGLYREQDRLSRKLAGLPLEQQMSYLARHPREARKLTDYLDDVMGNWTALSRIERQVSPALIFYPFIRMSLRWTFWAFPKRHPIKASIMYFLGQQQAHQLAELLGGDPEFFPDLATAPIRGGEDGRVSGLLPLARIAPGSNALIEAAGQGGGAQLLKVLNPALVAPIVGATGVDPLSGRRVGKDDREQPSWRERGALALSQLLALPAPVRAIDTLRGPREFGALPVVGKRREDSALSELIDKLRAPGTSRALRGAVIPFLLDNADDKRALANLGRVLDKLGRKPSTSEIAAARTEAELRDLARRKREAERAQDALDAMFRFYGISTKADKARVKRNFQRVPTFPRKPKAAPSGGNPWTSGGEGSSTSRPRSGAGANPWK